MIKIEIGEKEYLVREAKSDEEKMKGLLDVESLAENEGMLFYYNPPEDVAFWMKDTSIPLDIIFINEDEEVISILLGTPFSEDLLEADEVAYVLEVNLGSGILIGDELDIEDDSEESSIKMKVLAPDGSTLMELEGGERIFSRKNTKSLIKLAKKAHRTKEDKDYKALGKRLFKYLHIQDTNEPEYVESPT